MGGSEKKHHHLCRWDSIAKPKLVGGWGLRNIFLFNKSLASNSLWHVLSQDGIWHRVIIGKYISHISVPSWLRHTFNSPTNASLIWRSLLKYIHIIQHWLCWKPRSGHTIHIGRDVILGLGTSAYLSSELLNKLHEHHIYYLFQAKGLTDQGDLSTRWKNCTDLDLSGDLAIEWQRYCKALLGAGIQLREQEDVLLWNGGDCSGNISAKNLYDAIASTIWIQKCTGWRKQLWHWNIPLKIKLFTWLAATNKILTWDNLLRRVGRDLIFSFFVI
jgi:hypothetical protein